MINSAQDTAPSMLLIPIALEAMVVNDKVNDNVSFSLWSPNYENLSNSLASPLPDPFDDQSQQPSKGIYLHWILPDALTHGLQSQSTSGVTTDYPLLPNRWLIARIGSDPSTAATQRNLKAWLVQSDYLSNSAPYGSNPFVNPNVQTFEVTTLGKTWDLESWTEPTTAQTPFLKAVGPGNITFSAHTSEVMDVLTFYDALADLPDLDTTTYNLSYVTIAWHADPTTDLLQSKPWTTADQWASLMQSLNWTISNWMTNPPQPLPPVEQLPKQTLYHGMAYGVTWQNQTLPDRPNLDPTKLRLAIGNTGIDAFAALMQKAGSDAGQTIDPNLLEAFQYTLLPLLNDPDGDAQVAFQACQTWYASNPGGIYWKIVSAQRSNLDDTSEVTVQITPAQAAKLAQLNAIQTQLNQKVLQLQSRQEQLYSIWWKQLSVNLNGYSSSNSLYPEDGFNQDATAWNTVAKNISNALNESNSSSLIANIKQLQAAIESLAGQVPNPTDPNSISNYATTTLQLPDTLQLKFVPMPRFYEPTDPVLMIGGIEWPDRYIYGGLTNAGTPLPTRFQNQVLTGLKIGSTTINVSDSQLNGAIPLLPQNNLSGSLNSLITTLLQEAFLLDPASADMIAAKYNLSPTDVATAIANQAQQGGNRPADLAIFQWQQAWSPLFLEWKVNWYPTPPVQSVVPYNPDQGTIPPVPTDTKPINWAFDGQDYTWGGGAPQADNPVQTYKGRIVLSPHITFGFIARLKQYLQDNPNDQESQQLQAIESLIEQVGEWNFLSQALSGFCHDLIMKDISQTVPPTTPLANNQPGIPTDIAFLIGSQYHAVPYTNPGAWTDPTEGLTAPFNYFFPIRAGHFMFAELRVVDRFGQILNLLRANDNPQTDPDYIATGFQPIYGKGLKPDDASFQPYFLKQPPRLVQPTQLDFRFLSASDDTQQTDLNPAANPVCGWVLPNHLDQSLAIYDVAGNLLGELMVIANAQGSDSTSWQPTPGVTSPITPDQITNLHLKQFVQGILGLNDQGSGLQSLLQVVDETLWTVDPLGGRGDQELSVLIGRPIALVRAQVQFQLSGDPVADQAWSQTLGLTPRGTDVFTNVTFPIKLGSLELYDDGLLGYFLNDNYQQFNAVHPGTNSPYIVPIGGANNNYIQLPINYPGKPNNQLALVTLLLDPRGCIHATSGLQPGKKLTLPATYTKPMAKLDITFRVGSLLTDSDAIRLPIPPLKQGDWSWIEHSDPNTWNVSLPIVQANQKPRLANTPPLIRNGWLKLET
ncbi:MAG TPA: hypothetical protein V6C65_28030, partial [Allocoleopsis sp.]